MKSFCIKNILCDRKPLVYKYTYHGQTMRSLLIETREELLQLIYIYNQIIPLYPLKRCYFEIYTQLNATFLWKCTLWQHFCTSVACLHPMIWRKNEQEVGDVFERVYDCITIQQNSWMGLVKSTNCYREWN